MLRSRIRNLVPLHMLVRAWAGSLDNLRRVPSSLICEFCISLQLRIERARSSLSFWPHQYQDVANSDGSVWLHCRLKSPLVDPVCPKSTPSPVFFVTSWAMHNLVSDANVPKVAKRCRCQEHYHHPTTTTALRALDSDDRSFKYQRCGATMTSLSFKSQRF